MTNNDNTIPFLLVFLDKKQKKCRRIKISLKIDEILK